MLRQALGFLGVGAGGGFSCGDKASPGDGYSICNCQFEAASREAQQAGRGFVQRHAPNPQLKNQCGAAAIY